ncbi:MAG TPA: PH domain-containing protein [Tepidisphaeraceae bacterium]|jgi:membrane protein YdbS with pleckstrin-like domain|nr:PH domain-containing protein [Tepidisphaeraceae bacterium]
MTQAPPPHQPAGDHEEVYFQGSPLLRGQLATSWHWAFIGLLIAVAPIVANLAGLKPSTGMPAYVFLIALCLGALFIIVPWLKTKTVRYRISNYRIDIERGLLSRTIDTLELWHVEDLKFRQSLLERILGVGTITVISHDDTTPLLNLHGLPDPRQLFQTLEQRVIAVKRQPGVMKMDTGS